MSNDLINREALKKAVEERIEYDNAEDFDKGYSIALQGVIDLIDNAPTVPLPDFKEGYKQAMIDGKTNYSRQQGEWINHGYSFYICNNCGMGNNNAGGCKTNFCPNCGADMRKEKKNDTV